jgi:hypothetical protein
VTTTNVPRRSLTLVPPLLVIALAGCTSKLDASRESFTRGMRAYLERRGDLCVGRPSWPIDVDTRAGAAAPNDALQLPVLERLGLATSTVLPVRVAGQATPFEARRYRLTAEGRAHYLDRRTRQPVSPDEPDVGRHADLCVLSLGLAKVERWEVQKDARPPTALVSYTYTVEAPAWASDAGFEKVFPAVARVRRGAGTAQLVEGFTLGPDGWTANELLPAAPAARPAAPQAAR